MIVCRPRRIRFFQTLVCFLILPSKAYAHMNVEGAGDIVNGFLHPLMSPAHVLIVLGLGLLLGQQVPLDLKTPVRVLAPCSAVALVLTTCGWGAPVNQPILAGLALCVGLLVALDLKLPRFVSGLLCAAAGMGIALDSAVEAGSAFTVVKTLSGTWISLNVAIVYLAICASHGAGKPWAKTGIRVLGSWIFAISLLVIAFSLRKN